MTSTPTPPAPVQPPTRVCPHCHAQSASFGPKCPHCGKKYKKRSAFKTFAMVMVGGFVLLVGGCAALISSFDSGSSGSSKSSAKKTTSVGSPVTLAGTTYKVTSVETKKKIGPAGFGDTADGTFVLVHLNLTNHKSESKTFDESNAKIITSGGTKYSGDSEAWADLPDNLFLKQIQPDLTTKGTLVFDVPPSKLHDAKLRISDIWGAGSIDVDLGL